MLNYISTIKNLRTRGNKMTQLYQNLTSLPSIKWPNRSWDQSLKCHTSPPPKPWGARGRETSEFRALYWRSVTSPSLSPLRPQRVRGLRHVTFRTTVTTKSIRQNKVKGPSFVFDFVIDVKVFFILSNQQEHCSPLFSWSYSISKRIHIHIFPPLK